MNKVIMTGNLCNDPEVRQTNGGVSVCTFKIAVQRNFKNEQGVREADFFSVVVWRQLAELCGKYLQKGRKVAVTGCLQNRNYDAQDGSKRFVTEIIADEVEFIEPKRDEGKPAAKPAPQPTELTPADSEDDLPF